MKMPQKDMNKNLQNYKPFTREYKQIIDKCITELFFVLT